MFFGLLKSYFLGVDFGTSLIKIVELTMEGKQPRLVNFGQVDLSPLEKDSIPAGSTYDEQVVLYLRALLKRFHPKSDRAYVAMPAFTGLVSLVDLPEMNEDELKEAIQFEAHKYIPSSLDDVALSWEIVGMRPPAEGVGGSRTMEILLVAALKKEVERYRTHVESAHLKMSFLELETFSLVRSIIGDDPGLFLVIDIGSRATNLVLVDDGVVKVSRNLDVGGGDVTHTLMESLGITLKRAEELKKSAKDFLNTPEVALVFPSLEIIASEAKRMISGYLGTRAEKTCTGVVLSGGTAQLTGLQAYYSKIFQLPVTVGDPWRRIKYDKSLETDVRTMGTSFSVALGLALSGIDARVPKKDYSDKKQFSLKELLNKKL